jgi:hypothetical protein
LKLAAGGFGIYRQSLGFSSGKKPRQWENRLSLRQTQSEAVLTICGQ